MGFSPETRCGLARPLFCLQRPLYVTQRATALRDQQPVLSLQLGPRITIGSLGRGDRLLPLLLIATKQREFVPERGTLGLQPKRAFEIRGGVVESSLCSRPVSAVDQRLRCGEGLLVHIRFDAALRNAGGESERQQQN